MATGPTKLLGGGVNVFSSSVKAASSHYYAPNAHAAYIGPVGFQIGPRNRLRGPHQSGYGIGQEFPDLRGTGQSEVRADAFNVLNHPNFNLPVENSFNGFDNQDFQNHSFGNISSTVEPSGNLNNGARVLVSLRLEF